MAFGLLEVSRYERVTQVGDSPLWMDDGRIVIGSSEKAWTDTGAEQSRYRGSRVA
jgi:hypothetical protein